MPLFRLRPSLTAAQDVAPPGLGMAGGGPGLLPFRNAAPPERGGHCAAGPWRSTMQAGPTGPWRKRDTLRERHTAVAE